MAKISIDELQLELYQEYVKNGYRDMWNLPSKYGNKQAQKIYDISELGLIITEVSEAIEEIRKQKNKFSREHLAEECADIIIRTLNFMTRNGLNLEIALYLKNNKNLTRGKLHGKYV